MSDTKKTADMVDGIVAFVEKNHSSLSSCTLQTIVTALGFKRTSALRAAREAVKAGLLREVAGWRGTITFYPAVGK